MDNIVKILSSFLGKASSKIRQPKLSNGELGGGPLSPAALNVFRDSFSVSIILHIRLDDVPRGEDLNPGDEEWWYG